MLYRHQADVFEDIIRPAFRARILVAGVAVRVLLEDCLAGRGEGYEASRGELVEDLVAFNGVDDGKRIPHLLELVFLEELVDPFDRVGICPVEVGDDFSGAIIQRITNFTRREDKVYIFGKKLEELEGITYGGGEVVVVLEGIAEDSAHHIDVFDLLGNEVNSVKWGVFIRAGLQEAGKAGDKANRSNGNGLVRLGGKYLAVEFVAVEIITIITNGALEERLAICGAGVGHVVIRDENARIFYSILFQADRDIWITVVIVHDIHGICVGTVHTVNDYPQKGAALHIHITVKHHKGEKIVCGRTHIAVVDDADVLLFIVGEDVDVLFGVINRMLAVITGELDSSGQAVFRETAVAVEIEEAGIWISPSSYDVTVGVGMFETLAYRLAGEAVLGFLVGNVEAFFRVAECVQVERETVRIGFAQGPDVCCQVFVRESLGLSSGLGWSLGCTLTEDG